MVIFFTIMFGLGSFYQLVTLNKELWSVTLNVGIYVPLIYFAYKYYKYAFPVLMTYSIFDKTLVLLEGKSYSLAATFWLIAIVYVIYRAWLVAYLCTIREGLKLKKLNWFAYIVYFFVVIILLYAFPSILPEPTHKSNEDILKSNTVNILCTDNNQNSGGSGFLFTETGLILTNAHVIPKDSFGLLIDKCIVAIPDPTNGVPLEIYNAKPILLKDSRNFDLAFFEIISAYTDEIGKPYGSFPKKFITYDEPKECSSKEIKLGESIKIYGYPSINGGTNLTITEGVISSFLSTGEIMTSAKITNGNSGGIAVTNSGCIVGVPSSVLSSKHESYGIIIPIEKALDLVNESKKSLEEKTSDLSKDSPKFMCRSKTSIYTGVLSGEELEYTNEEDYGLAFVLNLDALDGRMVIGNKEGSDLTEQQRRSFKISKWDEIDESNFLATIIFSDNPDIEYSLLFMITETEKVLFGFKKTINPPISGFDEVKFYGTCTPVDKLSTETVDNS